MTTEISLVDSEERSRRSFFHYLTSYARCWNDENKINSEFQFRFDRCSYLSNLDYYSVFVTKKNTLPLLRFLSRKRVCTLMHNDQKHNLVLEVSDKEDIKSALILAEILKDYHDGQHINAKITVLDKRISYNSLR